MAKRYRNWDNELTDFGSFSDISRNNRIPTGNGGLIMRVKLQSEFLLPEHVSRGGEFPAENGSISDNDMFCALGGKLGGNCADEDKDGVGGGGESVTHAEDDLLVRPPRGYGAVAGRGGLGSGGGAFAGLIGGVIGNRVIDGDIGDVINGLSIDRIGNRVIDGVIDGVMDGLTDRVINGLTIDRIGIRVIDRVGNRVIGGVINRVIDGLIERVVNELIDRVLDTICDRLIKSGNGEIALMIVYLILRGWICNGTTERILCRRIDASVAIADWLFHPGLDRSIRVARTTERRVASRRRL